MRGWLCGLIGWVIVLGGASSVCADHRVLLQGHGRLAIIEPDGRIDWEMKWGGIHDLHMLPDGLILTRQGKNKVVKIDPATKSVVWTYDSGRSAGNAGRPVEVHAFETLGDGRMMIAESGPARLIEIDEAGELLREIALTVDHPSVHSDTRLVRRTADGQYLVAHEADGCVRRYNENGKVTWKYDVPLFGKPPADGHGPEGYGNRLFTVIELDNGNVLIATGNGHGVLEVTADKEIVWQIGQDDLPGIRLAWVTTLQVLPGGNLVIGNCHAGPGQPLLIEIEPASKRVVWTLDRFDDFGNDVSNAIILTAAGSSPRQSP